MWTGNEVWVIAGSALLFLAFPKAFASGFSGFYLALMIMLWLLMGRGWRSNCESMSITRCGARSGIRSSFLANLLLAFVVGLVVGNLLRGVPLNASGYISSFRSGPTSAPVRCPAFWIGSLC